MRRVLLTAAGLAALTMTSPGAALAGQRHHHHHKRRSHHAKISFRHLGPLTPSTVGPGAASGPAPTATTPTTSEENAGKVASYANGVLTLTLNDGSSVSGRVTDRTRIECVSATPPPPPSGQGDEGGPGDDNGPGDDQSEGDRNQGENQAGDPQPPLPAEGSARGAREGDNGGGDDDRGDDGPPSTSEPPCDTSALLPNAIVREAELSIGPGGTAFESIELVR